MYSYSVTVYSRQCDAVSTLAPSLLFCFVVKTEALSTPTLYRLYVFLPTKPRAGPLDGIDQWDFIVNSNGVAAEANSPRQEMLYNFDPYVLTTNDDDDL